MLSPHILQALVVADHAARLRAEADGARLSRAAAAERRAGAGRPASRSLAAVLRSLRRDVGAPSWPAPAVAPSLRDSPDPAPGC
jgi:hypothetical protein